MAEFYGIAAGEEKLAPGLRVKVQENGERVWMHGKWLDLGPDHAVAWISGKYKFVTCKGKRLLVGEFPAWVVRAKAGGVLAIMFNVEQFRGGQISVQNHKALARS